jgi:tetratricopeptide (TPR) repeat protein
MLYQRGEYREAVAFANMALQGPGGPTQPDAYVVGGRAMAAAGQTARARTSVENLRKLGHATIAAREAALLERTLEGPEASQKAIRDSKLDLADPANLEVLQQAVENLSLLGRTKEALALIDAATAKSETPARLHELRGLALGRSGDAQGAIAAFEKALELDPKSAAALAGLGTLRGQAGEFDAAIDLFDRADAQAPGDGSYAYSAAQISLAAGKREDAITRLRGVVKRHPGLVGARNDLAYLLAEDGKELDEALALATEAKKRSPTPEVLDTLGFVHLRRNETKQAVDVLEQAAAADATSPSIRYRLGTALEKSGDKDRARASFEAALALGDFPEAAAARAELARLGK